MRNGRYSLPLFIFGMVFSVTEELQKKRNRDVESVGCLVCQKKYRKNKRKEK